MTSLCTPPHSPYGADLLPHNLWSNSGHLGCGAPHPDGGCCHSNHSGHEEKGVMTLASLEGVVNQSVLALAK